MERLQKVIANNGYCSRRKAEELIQNGNVKVSDKDEITINGNVLNKEQKEYYLLYKPRGIITSTKDEKNRKTVVDLIPTKTRIYPVGRLDYDTSGILLLTNDGALTNALIHPSNMIDKVYVAKVKGFVLANHLKLLSSGIMIDGKKTSKGKVKLKKYDKKANTSIVELTIHEGRNHQVKKMFEAIGYGEYRRLSPKEVKILYNDVIKKN